MSPESSPTARRLGRVGLPAPLAELAGRRWDVVVVGAGHNGLACAAYLARGGREVLVLEARDRVGGACTIDEVWPGHRISPCAYLAGLLHPVVCDELGLWERGLRWHPAEAGLFVPFDDGSSVQLWEDPDRCAAEISRFAPDDLAGWRHMTAIVDRARDALRPDPCTGRSDLWLDPEPEAAEIERRIGDDDEVRGLLFEWSMAEFVARHLDDERLQQALLGQGVIGTFASPFDPGTASINFHHSSGRLGGRPGVWGYVEGGMGMVSFLLCDAAVDAGAVVATGVPVAAIEPGRGVVLADGGSIPAPVVVVNADPVVALGLLGDAADPDWRARVEAVPMKGCTLKVNVALRELPDFVARPGTDREHHRGQVNTPLTHDEWRAGYADARRGRLPDRLWTELYFQTAVDPSVAPEGIHTMSVFAQYVPPDPATGWDAIRDEAGHRALDAVARHCSNLPDAVVDVEVKGPPDIAESVGLTGGHIFQGECLPDHMWHRRLRARTPMTGVYLCGAATHPGGSVIGANGRNAARVVLDDTGSGR